MFTRTRFATAATFLAGVALGQEPTTLPPVQLSLPVYQSIQPGTTPPNAVPRTTNPLMVRQPTNIIRVGGQGPMFDPKLGPSPMNIMPMVPSTMVPPIPMQPITPTAPLASPDVTTLPPTSLGMPVEQQHIMPMPAMPTPTAMPIAGEGELPHEAGIAYPGRPVCFPRAHYVSHQLFSHLCWTPPPAHCWVDAEYLTWWMRGTTLPAIVTRGSPADAVPGALNQPGTTTLFGGTLNDEIQSGLRVTLGSRFGSTRSGWEVRGFLMNDTETNFDVGSSAYFPVIARPFFDPVLNQQASILIGSPGAFAGQVSASLKTTWWGAEANLTRNINDVFLDHLFVGFRYMELIDVLKVKSNYSVLPAGVAFINGAGVTPGSFGTVEESVRSRNQFYGGQVGIRERWSIGRFTLDMRGSVAIGDGLQRVDIRGASSVVDTNGRTLATGGIVGQPSNIGRYDRNDLTVIPEASARMTFAFTSHITLFAGYDFLYWANVARVGDQIDPRIDSRQVPISPLFTGSAGTNPVVGPRSTSFWAHGVSFGISLRY